jgi:hypothetical protein
MSKVYKKQYYVVATKDGQHYYTEGSFSEQEINKIINDFDIDEFINDDGVDEEFCGPEEGHYAVYRQSGMSAEQAIDIGYVTQVGDSYVYRAYATEEAIKEHDRIVAEIRAEVEAEFGDEDPLICLKQFAKVVA